MCPDQNPSQPRKEILIVAGEASGDLHGSNLVRAMHDIAPALSFSGIGGKRMKKAGVALIADSSEMAVVGLTEVASRLPYILSVRRRIKARISQSPPALVILIDYPDFNIPLAKFAHGRGVPVLYYISPQVWAWRKGRIHTLARCVDRMAVILPFEQEIYQEKTALDVRFTGHPLLDAITRRYGRDEMRGRLGCDPECPLVTMLPGSREEEVERLLPEMLKAGEILQQQIPGIRFILPLADTLSEEFLSRIVRRSTVNATIITKDVYDAIGSSDAAIVTSGTATLETALLEVPMIIVYKVSLFTYVMGRLFIDIDHIGLANIVAGKTVVPELIQGNATGERMAREIYRILTDSRERIRIQEELRTIREKLGGPGASRRTAELAWEMIKQD